MSTYFPGYSIDPSGRVGVWRATTHPGTSGRSLASTVAATRRRSGKKVTYHSPSPPSKGSKGSGRRSKKRSPRSSILRRLYRKVGKYSPRKFRNPYIRDFGEAMLVLGPILGLALALSYYAPPGAIKADED